MFKVNDIVRLVGNPFETMSKQMEEDVFNQNLIVTATRGQMLKTNVYDTWIHRNWFAFVTNDELRKMEFIPFPEWHVTSMKRWPTEYAS